MKIIITLLKAAVSEFENGIVADGDKLLISAMKLRNETRKAEKLAAAHFTMPAQKSG